MLICPKKLNSKLQNKLPIEKAKILEEDLIFYSTPYVNSFLEKYSECFSDWNDDIIEKRANDLSEQAYTVTWNFKPDRYNIKNLDLKN